MQRGFLVGIGTAPNHVAQRRRNHLNKVAHRARFVTVCSPFLPRSRPLSFYFPFLIFFFLAATALSHRLSSACSLHFRWSRALGQARARCIQTTNGASCECESGCHCIPQVACSPEYGTSAEREENGKLPAYSKAQVSQPRGAAKRKLHCQCSWFLLFPRFLIRLSRSEADCPCCSIPVLGDRAVFQQESSQRERQGGCK